MSLFGNKPDPLPPVRTPDPEPNPLAHPDLSKPAPPADQERLAREFGLPPVVVDAPVVESVDPWAPVEDAPEVKYAEDPTHDTYKPKDAEPAPGHPADPYYDTFRRNENK